MSDIETRIRKTVRARQLPADLTRGLGASPDTEVRVTVELARPAGKSRIEAIMDQMGAEAEASGLTPEILDDILNDLPRK